MRDGGQGLLEYDQLFQQQVVLNPSLPWNVIHSGLQLSHHYPRPVNIQINLSFASCVRRVIICPHNMLSPYSKDRLLEVTLYDYIIQKTSGKIWHPKGGSATPGNNTPVVLHSDRHMHSRATFFFADVYGRKIYPM